MLFRSNNNINNYNNLYLSSLSSSIVAINNVNNYQNLYLYSISSYILAYSNNNDLINNYQIDENNLYANIDYLGYERKGKHILMERNK